MPGGYTRMLHQGNQLHINNGRRSINALQSEKIQHVQADFSQSLAINSTLIFNETLDKPRWFSTGAR